jgi:hypothetical protein
MIIYTGTGDTDREVDERERWVKRKNTTANMMKDINA